jgi:hypothetical protein
MKKATNSRAFSSKAYTTSQVYLQPDPSEQTEDSAGGTVPAPVPTPVPNPGPKVQEA